MVGCSSPCPSPLPQEEGEGWEGTGPGVSGWKETWGYSVFVVRGFLGRFRLKPLIHLVQGGTRDLEPLFWNLPGRRRVARSSLMCLLFTLGGSGDWGPERTQSGCFPHPYLKIKPLRCISLHLLLASPSVWRTRNFKMQRRALCKIWKLRLLGWFLQKQPSLCGPDARAGGPLDAGNGCLPHPRGL